MGAMFTVSVPAFEVVGAELAARQPDREIRTEAEDRVVEARLVPSEITFDLVCIAREKLAPST